MKVKFFTLGCKVNQYETQALKERFSSLGHKVTGRTADLYVINTCTVTSRADAKSKDAIIRAKKENPKAKVAVCGCLVQLNRGFVEAIGVDYIIPQDQKDLLPDIVLSLSPVQKESDQRRESLKVSYFSNHRAFVKVQDGCDRRCSFCKIPYLRGKPRSKAPGDVIEEIRRISSRHREVVLCGVNLALYGRDLSPRYTLTGLVRDILSIPSLGRLRLSSLEASAVSPELLSLLENDKFCPHFHLPFQYGDDRILRAMNKMETVSLYREKVSGIRKIKPDAAISCDVMVGFPHEDEQSFQNTVAFIRGVAPMRMHIFTFSPRENTAFTGFKIKDFNLIRQRYEYLKELAAGFSQDYKRRFLGKVLNIVAERKDNTTVAGYTENYIRVRAKGKASLGRIVPVVVDRIVQDEVLASVVV